MDNSSGLEHYPLCLFRYSRTDGRRLKFSILKSFLVFIPTLFLLLIPIPKSYSDIRPVNSDFENRLDHFLERLTPLPEEKRPAVFGKYLTLIAREIDINNLFFSSTQELHMLLDSAVSNRIDVLTLFTLRSVQKKNGKTVVIDKDQLALINRKYNLHGLFLISSTSADGSNIVNMVFLILGQGRLIASYDKKKDVLHPEYNFATGRYEYQELFTMEASTNDDGSCGLYNIKGLSDPSESFQWMKGPLNSKIRSLSIPIEFREGGNIMVHYEFFGINTKIVPSIPIENY